jgi:hypothetical protein
MKKLVLIAIITVASFTACTRTKTNVETNSNCDSTKCDSTCIDSLSLMDSIGVRQVVEMDKHPDRY